MENGDPNEQGEVEDGVLAKLTQWDSSLEDMPKHRGLLKQSSEDTD